MKAFPNEFENSGMDLRDYFAAKAMQSLILLCKDDRINVTTMAYVIADSMMEHRKA